MGKIKPKRLTRDQKKVISANDLNPKTYMCLQDDGTYLTVINILNGAVKVLER